MRGRLDVSRETSEKLRSYVEHLLRWQTRINLIGPSSVNDIWHRHILDCAQIAPLILSGDHDVLDFGSGAGLPGLILSIIMNMPIHLVESDQRKAVFLREAVRVTGSLAVIHPTRLEKLNMTGCDLIVSRAVAPLDRLLGLVVPKLSRNGRIIVLKGRNVDHELTEANKKWTMRVEMQSSITAPDARVLILHGVEHGHSDA